MKLIKERFDVFAQEQGYASGGELFGELGFSREEYEHFRQEVPIGRAELKILCMELGAAEVMDMVFFRTGERSRYSDILEEF